MPATDLNIVRTGPRGGAPVVLVHAVGLDLTYWDSQIAALAPAFDVLAYDLRGHGASGPLGETLTFATSAADLAAVIEAADAGPAHVVGLSVGGMIAQNFALARPDLVRSLALLDTVCSFPDAGRTALQARAQTVRAQGMESVLASTLERWFTPGFAAARPDVIDRVAKTLRANDPQVHAAMWEMIATQDTAPRLQEVTAPTLVLVGEHDPSTPVAASQLIAERVPGARMHVIAGASHISTMEAAGAVNARLLDFLTAL